MHPTAGRLKQAVMDGTRSGLKTSVWLLSIMIPVSFLVLILDWTGILGLVSDMLAPLFRALDVPGSSALVFLSSVFINIYSAIAVMAELTLTLREVTILAMMALSAHNFLVEIPVLATTGTAPLRMIGLRILAALLAAAALGALLPGDLSERSARLGTTRVETQVVSGEAGSASEEGAANNDRRPFLAALLDWAVDSVLLVIRVAAILLALMIGERLLQELGVVRWLGKRLKPLMRVFGLPDDVAFLWVVSNTLGLAYGAGVLRREVADGNLSRRHGDLLNHHIAVSHSLLEDTLLFVALGVPALWITVPRIVLALLAVWERRAELAIRSRRRARRR